jgi:hypothetical protein
MAPRTKKLEPPKRGRDGFYTLSSGEKLLSVTNIIKFGVPLDLTGWTAWEVASLAVESVPRLSQVRGAAARRDAVNWLKGAADRKRDTAGDLGTAIHDAIENHILGQPAPEPTTEQKPFMDAFSRFLENERPEFEATEMVLAHPEDGWAGKADVWMTLPNIGPAMVLGDWKSGSGVYSSAALQLSGYKRAPVGWTQDGTEVVPPKVDDAVVVHIRPQKYPDTGYRIYPMDTSDDVYECFLSARKTAVKWMKGLEKTAVGEPYEPIVVAEEVA